MVVHTVSLVCADIAESFIFFIAAALVCIFNVRRVACVLTRCKLNKAVETLSRLDLPADWDSPCDRTDGNLSKGLSSPFDADAADLFEPLLDATELGLEASACIPYIGTFFLMILDLAEVIPVKLGGTPNGKEVVVDCLLFCFPLELSSLLGLLRRFPSGLP